MPTTTVVGEVIGWMVWKPLTLLICHLLQYFTRVDNLAEQDGSDRCPLAGQYAVRIHSQASASLQQFSLINPPANIVIGLKLTLPCALCMCICIYLNELSNQVQTLHFSHALSIEPESDSWLQSSELASGLVFASLEWASVNWILDNLVA
jgi:hypothetical protein